VDDAAFEGGLGAAIADPVVNLRQGAFAKRRRWQIEWALVRRLAFLTLAVIAVTLAIQVAAIFRYTLEADTLEMEANRVAATALQRTGPVSDGPRQLEQRLSDLRGGGPGYAALATGVFDAVRGTPDVEITALEFDPTGALRATVQAASPAAIASLQQRIEASGFTVVANEARSGGGRPTIDLIVRAP
jgi:general secretion pathway protein L